MLYKTEEKGISFLSTPGVGMQSATHSERQDPSADSTNK